MTVLEPAPGMGFFTLELARLVGPTGRVVAVDIQPRMLSRLKARAARVGLLDRIETRVATPTIMGITNLSGTIEFTLAFALVHEVPAAGTFFAEGAMASKPGAGLLFAEPAGHVTTANFETELETALHAGFELVGRPAIHHSHAALLMRT